MSVESILSIIFAAAITVVAVFLSVRDIIKNNGHTVAKVFGSLFASVPNDQKVNRVTIDAETYDTVLQILSEGAVDFSNAHIIEQLLAKIFDANVSNEQTNSLAIVLARSLLKFTSSRELADAFNEHREQLLAIVDAFVDVSEDETSNRSAD